MDVADTLQRPAYLLVPDNPAKLPCAGCSGAWERIGLIGLMKITITSLLKNCVFQDVLFWRLKCVVWCFKDLSAQLPGRLDYGNWGNFAFTMVTDAFQKVEH